MLRLLSDHDIELYVQLLWTEFSPEEWRSLGLFGCHTFVDFQIDIESTDRDVWLNCQRANLLLLTANRNMKDGDSLEATIRELNRPNSLPVITIAQPPIMLDSAYRETCAYRLADIVTDLLNLLGIGRQIIP